MKVSCELCRKVFKAKVEKLTSRGVTVYCPRCKHPHLIKRIVEPYPIAPEFKVPQRVSSPDRVVSSQEADVSIDSAGGLRVQPPPPPSQEKSRYHWKNFLRFRRREKRSKTARELMKQGRGAWAFLMRALFFVGLVGLAVGYVYFRDLTEQEKQFYVEGLRRLFHLNN